MCFLNCLLNKIFRRRRKIKKLGRYHPNNSNKKKYKYENLCDMCNFLTIKDSEIIYSFQNMNLCLECYKTKYDNLNTDSEYSDISFN